MSTQKRKGNRTLMLLLAAIVLVVAAIILLPEGKIAEEAVAQTEAAADDSELDEAAEIEKTTLVKRGMTAPDFTVEMLDGSKITLSELKGNVVLVNFWATWCPPCREELTHMQAEIVDRFAGQPFRLLAVSRGEKRGTVEKFIADQGYKFPVALDPGQDVFHKFASNYIPRNFLIDAEGKVVFVGVGYDEEEFGHLKAAIEETLKNL